MCDDSAEVLGPQQLTAYVLARLGMQRKERPNYDLYTNDSGGFLRLYGRTGLYTFGVADYTIDQTFSARFASTETVLRFGTLFDGTTDVRMADGRDGSSSPSSFVALQHRTAGEQRWEAGQHLSGAEFTIHSAYLCELEKRFPKMGALDLEAVLEPNRTYRYMPADLNSVMQRMVRADRDDRLDPLMLESAVLECLGIILEAGRSPGDNPFSTACTATTTRLPNGRTLTLMPDDIRRLEQARAILTRSCCRPPTIDALVREIGLNRQKLVCGFARLYKTTIGQYTTNLRMSQAALLLRTTEQDVGTIASHVGYSHASNFIKAFRRTYGCTPRDYRRRERRER